MIAYAPQNGCAFFIADAGLPSSFSVIPGTCALRHSRLDWESQRRALPSPQPPKHTKKMQPPGDQPSENPHRA